MTEKNNFEILFENFVEGSPLPPAKRGWGANYSPYLNKNEIQIKIHTI